MTPALDGRDGIAEVSRQVVRVLIDRAGGNAVEVWAYRGFDSHRGGIRPRFRTGGGRRSRMLGWTLAAMARPQRDLTVIVMHLHLAPLARLLAYRGAKRVVFLHGIESWRPLRTREVWALRGGAAIVANSRRTATLFRAANPALPSASACLLGIGPGPAPVRWPGEPGFALIVGRLSAAERYKGHDALIDAWPLILDAVPGARLVVAGDGDDRARLQQRVAGMALTRSILFVGSVPEAELRGLYQACGMFVMPSSGEGFGLAYIEAMRDGKPCIALRTADEIIVDRTTGLLLDTPDAAALADALIQLFRDPGLRYRLGAAGAARMRAMFDQRHFARRFAAAIGLRDRPSDLTVHPVSAGA
jgi:phosphatidylinositol alpha-1,6-mannosyltransferase